MTLSILMSYSGQCMDDAIIFKVAIDLTKKLCNSIEETKCDIDSVRPLSRHIFSKLRNIPLCLMYDHRKKMIKLENRRFFF